MFEVRSLGEDEKVIHLWTRTSQALGFSVWIPMLGDTLLDSGFPRAEAALRSALSTHRVAQVLHTHVHEDHIGNDFFLQSNFETRLYACEQSVNDASEPSVLHYFPYEKIIWGIPRGKRQVAPLAPTMPVDGGLLEVIPTPGHTPDHVVFFDPRTGSVFGGDLFLSVKVRVARPQEDNLQLASSLAKVIDLRPRRLFCSHKGLIENPMPLLQAKLRFLEQSRDSVWSLTDRGWSPRTIAAHLFGLDSPLMYFGTSGDVTKTNFVKSFLHSRK